MISLCNCYTKSIFIFITNSHAYSRKRHFSIIVQCFTFYRIETWFLSFYNRPNGHVLARTSIWQHIYIHIFTTIEIFSNKNGKHFCSLSQKFSLTTDKGYEGLTTSNCQHLFSITLAWKQWKDQIRKDQTLKIWNGNCFIWLPGQVWWLRLVNHSLGQMRHLWQCFSTFFRWRHTF